MRPIKINFDKIIYIFVFVLASILIICQVVLTVNNAHIYTSTSIEETTFDVTLMLIGTNPSEDIAILSNGDVIAYFVNETIELTIGNNTVIEIDGRKVNKNFTVEIQNKNKTITDIPNKISVNSNIAMIGRFIAR